MTLRICTILARGGSKGVPGKNIRPLCGRPLLAWSIAQAVESGLFSLVAVSSDDEAILAAGKAAGAGLLVRRPAELATDTAAKVPAIVHCVHAAEAELGSEATTIVDLQPTSPLRLPRDICDAVELQEASGAESVITGQPAKCSPYFSLVEATPDGTVHLAKTLSTPVVRRQDAPACYDMNGSVYVWPRHVFMERPGVLYPTTRIHIMPDERSIDIDTELDFKIAEFVMTHQLSSRAA